MRHGERVNTHAVRTLNLRRAALAAVIILLIVAAAAAFAACDGLETVLIPGRAEAEDVAEQVVRIHIRANSNSAEDQSVKLAVRDEVTAYLTSALEGCRSKSDALDSLAAEKENLRAIAQSVLDAHGYDYKAAVELKKESFPDREYDGCFFPAGVYDALMIYLGEGEGDNWWCVAFPPLCFVPDADGEQIVYASWVKELIDKIFS